MNVACMYALKLYLVLDLNMDLNFVIIIFLINKILTFGL